VRAVFLVLLAANLLFLAWAHWIDTPAETDSHSLSRLPRLKLVSEAPPQPKPTSANIAPLEAEKVALEVSGSCTSLGPFNDIASAARAAGLLSQRGFQLRQRAEEGETIEGYWVFVGGMQSDADVNEVVSRLEKSGFTDAHVMKNYSANNRRVSVGMFSTRARAERRAAAVKNMGFEPEIGERRFPGTIYWVDVDSGPGESKLPHGYTFTDIGLAKVEMHPCAPGVRPAESDSGSDTERDGLTPELPQTKIASAPTPVPRTNVASAPTPAPRTKVASAAPELPRTKVASAPPAQPQH
jgi:hypothetical protein